MVIGDQPVKRVLRRGASVEKVLACLLASTRAHELTFASFKKQVLDELNADLALALAIDEKYNYANPFWQHAKYRWTAPAFSDYGEAFDLAQRWLCQQYNVPAPDWRSMLRLGGRWQGGIKAPNPQPSASSMQFFCQWLLLHGLEKDGVLDRYDRFVITRSDFVWLCPHPPLSVLDRDNIWFPNGEYYGGFTPRHVVVSRADVANYLNMIEDVLLHPIALYEEMKNQKTWNIEQFLAHHLRRRGLLEKVRVFPYVMYLARSVYDKSATRSLGHYEPVVGHFVKYKDEFDSARAYATIIRSRSDWEGDAWMRFNPTSVASRPCRLRRLQYACERTYYETLSALQRASPQSFQSLNRTLSALDWYKALVRLARWPLTAVPKKTVMPILSGPNRGLWWNSGSSTHGCWLGWYEKPCVEFIATLIQPGMVAFDVGANVGYYTLLLARGVGPKGRVIAFEPNPANVVHLKKHLRLNKISNVDVVEAAVSDKEGVHLDDYPRPDLIRMDIQGGQTTAALCGSAEILAERHAVWFISLHGLSHIEIPNSFADQNYTLDWVTPSEICARAV